LVTKCWWDTVGETAPEVTGGEATSNEMCYIFLWYYPRVKADFCFDMSNNERPSGLCGLADEVLPATKNMIEMSKLMEKMMPFDPERKFKPYKDQTDCD